MMKCETCGCELGKNNQSGYCSVCYFKSPPYLAYQRVWQLKYYYKTKGAYKKDYCKRNKKKVSDYGKKWRKENKEKRREYAKKWYEKEKGIKD